MRLPGLRGAELLRELCFLHSNGALYGGADAVVAVARYIWWARPFVWLSKIPEIPLLLVAGYRWIANRRSCDPAIRKAEKVLTNVS